MRRADKEGIKISEDKTYFHKESGFSTKDQYMYEALMKYYKYVKLDADDRKQTAECHRKTEVNNLKIVEINKELEPLQIEWKNHTDKKSKYQTIDHKKANSKLEEYKTEIKKLQLAAKMISGSMEDFRVDSSKEYDKKFPFPEVKRKKMESLLVKLYKLK